MQIVVWATFITTTLGNRFWRQLTKFIVRLRLQFTKWLLPGLAVFASSHIATPDEGCGRTESSFCALETLLV